jgi:hypothetical protein
VHRAGGLHDQARLPAVGHPNFHPRQVARQARGGGVGAGNPLDSSPPACPRVPPLDTPSTAFLHTRPVIS